MPFTKVARSTAATNSMTARPTKNMPRARDKGRASLLESESPGGSTAPVAPKPGEPGDHQQVAAFLRGEPEATEIISTWVKQAASRYRQRLPAEWDDLLQDLLLEVTVTLQGGSFRGHCQLRTYVWRIAHYRCLNRIRDLARRPETELGDSERQVRDPAPPVLDRLVNRESVDLLLRFLGTVSADCRRLWNLILAGRSYREISHETGISEGALRVRVLRCRKKAVALWKRWLESPDG